MTTSHSQPIAEGSRLCGYTIKRIVALPEINAQFFELEHITTSARHIHIKNSDTENTFSVAFKTVPQDSTGVAHILEHTALCGSKKFPVRDPFFSMLKRSLSTFMNAFTASDWTMYPFSTQNKQDFFNLMAVYLDAVFFPILDPLNFKQEGHRLEIEEEKNMSRLVYKGIVYNEMKGAMSSPDQVLSRSIYETLYPDTTYRFNSGGDPTIIPQLSYEKLKAFHKRHYHPSNAFFYTYGDIHLEDILEYINGKALSGFDRIDPKTEVPSQPRWKQPIEKTYYYPLAKEEDASKKCQVCMAWLSVDIKDTFEVLALTILEQVLLGNSASPLRKALIDSGLGTALSDGTGFSSDNKDTFFCCGLKDVEASSAKEIEKIIFTTLEDLIDNGIDKNIIESAIHQLEFYRKEVTNHPYPYGVKLILMYAGSWFHGGDPIKILKFEDDIEAIRKQVKKGPFLETRIRQYFIENLHRVRLTLAPDQDMEAKEDKRVADELKKLRKKLNASHIEKINEDANALKRLQESEEDLSSLPTLEVDEIPPSVQIVEESSSYKHIPASCYQKPTSGIFYFTAAIGLGMIEDQLLPLVPFFCHVFSRIGTTYCDYVEMVKRIDAHTGGIGLSAQARTGFGESDRCVPFIAVNGKCLDRNEEKMFEILQELLFHFDLSDLTHLRHLLLEYRAGMESMIIHGGHRLAMLVASRNFSTTSALSEIWHGIHQLKVIKDITDNLTDEKLAPVSESLINIGHSLLKKDNIQMAVIGGASAVEAASESIVAIEDGFINEGSGGFDPLNITESDASIREGWSTASAVSFVARTFQTVRTHHEDAPALYVISKLLRSQYLHREIREKGGAYGGFALYNSEDGIFSFASYRDPHILTTLKAYDGAVHFIRSDKIGDEDVKEAILQTCSDIDKPDPPGPAAKKAFYRKIIGLNDDARNWFKQTILSLTRQRVQSVAEKYFHPTDSDYSVAVISSDEKLKAANQKMKSHPLTLHRI